MEQKDFFCSHSLCCNSCTVKGKRVRKGDIIQEWMKGQIFIREKYTSYLRYSYSLSDNMLQENLPKIHIVMHSSLLKGQDDHRKIRWQEPTYFLARYPRQTAWKKMMMSVIFRSRSSSKCAKTPARKKILLCPILYKLGSSSKALI